jgi:hypothetical protein
MKISKFILPVAMAAFFLVLPGCGQDKEEQQSAKTNTPVTAPVPLPETVKIIGQVTEILDAGNFIFVLMASNKEKVWVTVPKVDVEIGETVTMNDATLLENFHSKTLNRTFDTVMFSSGIEGKTPIIKRQMRRSQGLTPPPQ